MLNFRTDAGVHSTGSTCNVDLQRSAEGKYFFEPIYITTQMNKLLIQADLDIKYNRWFKRNIKLVNDGSWFFSEFFEPLLYLGILIAEMRLFRGHTFTNFLCGN